MSKINYMFRNIAIAIIALCCVLLQPNDAFAATRGQQNTHYVTFSYFNTIIVPLSMPVVVNVGEDYNKRPGGDEEITRIDTFVKVDQPPIGSYSVNGVNVHYMTIDDSEYKSFSNDSNVLVSPTWIWCKKYTHVGLRDYIKPLGTMYSISGCGAVLLSPDCVPTAFNNLVTNLHVRAGFEI